MKKTVRKAASSALLGVYILCACVTGAMQVFAQSTINSSYCTGGSNDTLLGSGSGSSYQISDVIKYIVCFLEQSIVPFLFALALCVFIYGMAKFIGTQDSGEREQGKQFMLWGIIALAVMFSVWGLVAILGNTFGVNNVIPQLPVS